MTEPKFTKGPYHVGAHVNGAQMVIGPGNIDLTACYWQPQPNGGSAEANAYLFAAAPDLYEALREMLAAHSMDNIGVAASLRRTNSKKAARAALAKADGGGE